MARAAIAGIWEHRSWSQIGRRIAIGESSDRKGMEIVGVVNRASLWWVQRAGTLGSVSSPDAEGRLSTDGRYPQRRATSGDWCAVPGKRLTPWAITIRCSFRH